LQVQLNIPELALGFALLQFRLLKVQVMGLQPCWCRQLVLGLARHMLKLARDHLESEHLQRLVSP
jgi:hypothetical protein